jgi:DNA-binding HxlR family transcriptional regulator
MHERAEDTAPVDQVVFEDSLATFRAKWAIPALLQIRLRTLRFSEIERQIGPVTHKALAEALRLLEREGFVERRPYATIPPKVEYAITQLGEDAVRACEAFARFAVQHRARVLEARRDFDEKRGG